MPRPSSAFIFVLIIHFSFPELCIYHKYFVANRCYLSKERTFVSDVFQFTQVSTLDSYQLLRQKST
jgi:hypothetical protein